MNSNLNPLYGFLIGFAAGAAASILMAPDKGRRTRKKIARRVDKLENDIEKLWGKVTHLK